MKSPYKTARDKAISRRVGHFDPQLQVGTRGWCQLGW